MNLLAEYVTQRSDLPREELEWLARAADKRVLRRGDAFCQIGQTRHEYGFLLDGILQVYGVTSAGERIVLDLLFPGSFAIAWSGASRGLPSEACFEAVTACTLLAWSYELRLAAFARHPGWYRLGLRMAEDAFNQKQERYLAMRVLSAEERYARMVAELPDGWRAIPQHLVASYLGITPQYLSRIKRAQLAHTKEKRTHPTAASAARLTA